MSDLPVLLAGEELVLLPEKAVYWPAERLLVIADIHFGKAAAFRTLGVPVPRGTTTDNLARLGGLVERLGAQHVLFLGDFLHARAAHAAATVTAMVAWRTGHPDLRLTLVRGNHDRHAGDPAAALGMQLDDEPLRIGPFAFCHDPELAQAGYVLGGHVHPVYHLRGRADTLRLPCFVVGEQRMILPSFGAFTGGHPVRPGPGERIYVTSGEAVLAVQK